MCNAAAQLVDVLIVQQLCELVGILFASSLILDTAQCYVRQQFNQFCTPDWHSAARHSHVLSFSVFFGCALVLNSIQNKSTRLYHRDKIKVRTERLNLHGSTGFIRELMLG